MDNVGRSLSCMGSKGMMTANAPQTICPERPSARPVTFRHAAQGKQPTVLSNIYREETNIAVWQRKLSTNLQDAVKGYLSANATLEAKMVISPKSARSSVSEIFKGPDLSELCEDIALLVDMFCCLFETKDVGLRLKYWIRRCARNFMWIAFPAAW